MAWLLFYKEGRDGGQGSLLPLWSSGLCLNGHPHEGQAGPPWALPGLPQGSPWVCISVLLPNSCHFPYLHLIMHKTPPIYWALVGCFRDTMAPFHQAAIPTPISQVKKSRLKRNETTAPRSRARSDWAGT